MGCANDFVEHCPSKPLCQSRMGVFAKMYLLNAFEYFWIKIAHRNFLDYLREDLPLANDETGAFGLTSLISSFLKHFKVKALTQLLWVKNLCQLCRYWLVWCGCCSRSIPVTWAFVEIGIVLQICCT